MKNRYTVVKICENCVFPQGLYRLRDKETGWKIIMEDKKDVDCIKDYLISKDEQIRSLEEKLAEQISKSELKEHMPAYCTLAGRDCEYMGKVKSLEEQLKNAICPKFKIGQEIWDCISKRYWKVNRIELTEENWEVYRLGHDGTEDYNCCIMPNDKDVFFATREDAEARLAELEGKSK